MVHVDISEPIPVKVAVVGRAQVNKLGDAWSVAGVYLLLDRPEQHGVWRAYVGKSAASGGVKGRLGAHAQDEDKPSWYRAVVICPITGDGWDEAQVSWLEKDIHRFLQQSASVSLSNSQEPGSKLAEKRQIPLRKVKDALVGVLALMGHPVAGRVGTQPQGDAALAPKETSLNAKLSDLLEAGLVSPGTRLVPADRRWSGEASITSEGRVFAAGRLHNSPSAAAQAVSGRKAESGWTFWAIESRDGPTLDNLRASFRSSPSTAPTSSPLQSSAPAQLEDSGGSQRPILARGSNSVQEGGTPKKKDRRLAGKTHLRELTEAGLVPAGTRLFSTSRKWPGEGRVLRDGRIKTSYGIFGTPSEAAKATSHGISQNGWRFWAVDSPAGTRLATLRDRFDSAGRFG